MSRDKLYSKSFSCLIFAIVFVVYLFTLSPNIHLEDTAEFATAAAVMGIAHPSGYPLYCFLGHLFTKLIPFGEIAWRVNLMSAFFGAFIVVLLFLINIQIKHLIASDRRLLPKPLPSNFIFYFLSFAAALCLAFSYSFWSQSVLAEVYTLNSFFVALLIWLLLRWFLCYRHGPIPQAKIVFYLFAFIYGLSITNHTMIILLAPVFLLFIFAIGGKKFILSNYHLLLIGIFLFFLGLSFYLYLPLRSLANPPLDWGNPESWHNLWLQISRAQYGDFNPFSSLPGKLILSESFFANLFMEFNPLIILLALSGLIILSITREKKLILLLGGIFLMNSLGIIFLRNFGWGINIEKIYSVYYLPCYIITTILCALSLYFFIARLYCLLAGKLSATLKTIIVVLACFCLLGLPLSLFVQNYNQNNQRNFTLVSDWSDAALNSLAPGAVLLVKGDDLTGDTQSFSLAYQKYVNKIRPDILIIDDGNVFKQPIGWHLTEDYFKLDFLEQQRFIVEYFWQYAQLNNRNLYTIFPVETNNLTFSSNGLLFEVLPRAKQQFDRKTLYFLPSLPADKKISETAKDFLASYYYTQATALMERGDKNYQEIFLLAIELDREPFSYEYQAFINHRGLINNQ